MKFTRVDIDYRAPPGEELRHIEGEFPIFASVVESLPEDITVLRATDHGNCSPWFRTGRIECRNSKGQDIKDFVKYAAGSLGKDMLRAEYYSQSKLYTLLPENVPKPLAWGDLRLNPTLGGYYFLTEFIEFHDADLPDVGAAGHFVAQLHARSKGTSSQFGTPVPLFDGVPNYINGWESSWPRLFAKMLFQLYHYNCLSNGFWDDLHTAIVPIIQIVVPSLLNELEKGDRKIEPRFIHGDLWNGNFGLDDSTGRLYLFDSSGYHAHHEMEFAY